MAEKPVWGRRVSARRVSPKGIQGERRYTLQTLRIIIIESKTLSNAVRSSLPEEYTLSLSLRLFAMFWLCTHGGNRHFHRQKGVSNTCKTIKRLRKRM